MPRLSKLQRDALVLQMHNDDAQRLKLEADAFRVLDPESFHLLARQEAIDLYATEMDKDRLREFAKANGDKEWEKLPKTDAKMALAYFDRAERANARLMYFKVMNNRVQGNLTAKDDPMYGLHDTDRDKAWKPPVEKYNKQKKPAAEA